MTEEFPPKPCSSGECAYGAMCHPSWSDPYGCGGCCGCYGCRQELELEQAYIPETPEQYKYRLIWERALEQGEKVVRWI